MQSSKGKEEILHKPHNKSHVVGGKVFQQWDFPH